MGCLSVNDVRRLENLNEIPEGDHYLEPLNMKDAAGPPIGPATGAPQAASPTAARDLTPIIDDALERIHKRAQQDIEARRNKLTQSDCNYGGRSIESVRCVSTPHRRWAR